MQVNKDISPHYKGQYKYNQEIKGGTIKAISKHPNKDKYIFLVRTKPGRFIPYEEQELNESS